VSHGHGFRYGLHSSSVVEFDQMCGALRCCAVLFLDTLTSDLQTDFLSCFVTCESNVESYATTMCYVLVCSMVYTRRA
jgi:hypothetical protein